MYRIIFLSAFYTVLATIATTVSCALLRARRSLRHRQAEAIRWHSDFEDLPADGRACRHALTGEMPGRECPRAFDCRGCGTHAEFATQAVSPAAAGQEEEIFGMLYPLNRLYHRGHTWVEPQADGTVRIGLDEIGRRIVGEPEAVELPPPRTQIEANGTAFRLRKRGAAVRVLAPVDGEVVETGGPKEDWYLHVRPSRSNFTHLLRGAELRPWVMREMERLQLALTAEGITPALADGGVLVEDIARACPAADWDALAGEMFLEP